MGYDWVTVPNGSQQYNVGEEPAVILYTCKITMIYRNTEAKVLFLYDL